jgi:hypothetical protein
MAQKTNLNVSPYFDDFDSKKNYYKVLFQPGIPVQTRELNNLQSILQNQIESFGSHIFKEGSVVIPGNITFDSQYFAVKVNNINFGIDVAQYLDQYIGKKITGQVSGVSATIKKIVYPDLENDLEYITLYVKYIDSDNSFKISQFQDGESLISNRDINYGNTTIPSGTPFVKTITSNSTSTGSSASIDDGIYFIRGVFARVFKDTIILDYYTNTPSYRVGLKVSEEIITAKDDETLYDNAKGFNNYAAPGADRFKINLSLTKKSLDSKDTDVDFIELLRVEDGQIKKLNVKTDYSLIRDYLAQRTYDESGNYSVNAFKVSLHNSLNNRMGNDGLYFENQKTDLNNTPSDDLMCVKISPGKAYVKGYDIDKNFTTILDIQKPRETKAVEDASIPFEMGNLIRINNISGALKNNSRVFLHSVRRSSSGNPSVDTRIGNARVYSLSLTDEPYNGSTTNWDLYLYDIQTNTKLTLNQPVSATELPATSYIKGDSSGAVGYVVSNGDGTNVVFVGQTSGSFIVGEQLIINGIKNKSRSISKIDVYDVDDIKQIYQPIGISEFATPFLADTVLDRQIPNGFGPTDTISIDSGGVVTCPGKFFNNIKIGSIIRYQSSTSSDEKYNRVVSINETATSMVVEAVPNVSGVCNGTITAISNIPFVLGVPNIKNQSKGSLYAEIPNANISSVNLKNSSLSFVYQSTSEKSSDSPITLSVADFVFPPSLGTPQFLPFDQERYSIHYTDGTIETLTADKFSLSNNQVTFSNLTPGKSTALINASFVKTDVQSKKKRLVKSATVNINYSKNPQSGSIAGSSLNDGLTYNSYYGLRVQDEEICLNYPDVSKILAIYESWNSSTPTLDTLFFSAFSNIQTNAVVGEDILGSVSGCLGRVVSKDVDSVRVVYLNSNRFIEGELVTFKISNIEDNITTISLGSYNDITNRYKLDSGQREQYYDYSRLIRNTREKEPTKRLLVVFDYYKVPSSDNGDVYTVLSYDQEEYSNLPSIGINNIKSSDILDFRPRVPVLTTFNRSPFYFTSRNSLSSIKFNLLPNENTIIGYDYYLGRQDKIYLDKNGNFIYDLGSSSVDPKSKKRSDDLMEIATITLPPYLYSPNNALLSYVDNRRYTMRDIGSIENRVKNLERVTSLSLLELSTQTLQIQDAEGFDRFKTGFFVDDFKDTSRLNSNVSFIEIDKNNQELTPIVSRNSLKNYLAPAANIIDEEIDLSTNYDLIDSNVQKTGKTVTLKYISKKWIEQPFATRVENVNPFNIVSYRGNIKLSPSRDNWVRTVQLPNKTISVTDYVLLETDRVLLENRSISIADPNRRGTTADLGISASQNVTTSTNTITSSSSTTNLIESRSEEYMRSRNTEFSIVNLKPLTQYYHFLDGNGSVDFIPKLLEIAVDSSLENYGSSGSFITGETVTGWINSGSGLYVPIITFRLAAPNHKYGPYNAPSEIFNINPYIKTESLSNFYNQSSKVLNIDTYSLSEEAQGLYSGYLVKGTRLIGETSGAIAYVKDLKLISDNYGDLIGSFFIRDPNTNPPPSVRINTGNKTYKVSSSSTNQTAAPGSTTISSAETNYTSEGVLELYETVITNQSTVTTTKTTTTTLTRTTATYFDPLAQSFSVGGSNTVNDDENGVFITSVDLFFYKKDSNNSPLTVELRTVELGTPTRTILGNSVTLKPDQINISDDGSIATTVTFDYPIFLEPALEYCIVLLAPESNEYEVFIAEMGEKTIQSRNLPDSQSVSYTQQFALGSLFKSQNGSIWTANQYQDMKFILYKAEFVTNTPGTAYFYNPTLNESNGYVKNLLGNPITTLPRKLTIGITTTTDSNIIDVLTPGRKISETTKTYVTGHIVGTGCSVSSVGITTGGKNYVTDNTGVLTYNISGNGSGLILNIEATAGIVTAVSIVNPGKGYSVGDIVGIVTSSISSNSGAGALITITGNNNGIDTLYLSNVKGQSFTNDGTAKLVYYNNSNAAITLDTTYIYSSSLSGDYSSGDYFKVNHFNHGMYAPNNKIKLSGITPNSSPTTLTQSLTNSSVIISVASTAQFASFEGIPVSNTNPGYVLIENEIIRYESVGNNSLGTITRGQDSTKIITHDINAFVYSYQLNGVSLRRINKTHDIFDSSIDMDEYYIKFLRNSNGTNRSSDGSLSNTPQLSFDSEGSFGGSQVFASENIQFDTIIPLYNVSMPSADTSISGKIRTVSGTSVSGDESSFVDLGYEEIQINTPNKLSSTRLICSKVNEDQYLNDLPRNKSFTTALTLSTSDKNLSPQIFLDNCFTDFHSYRINSPIFNYIKDNRVNSLISDPHSAIYVSNTVILAQNATSLKVIMSAYRHADSDFRVLYSLITPDSSEIATSFELFPGYDKLAGGNNSGLPDMYVRPSRENEYLEYEFTANNLSQFSGYIIKIVMSSTNQAYPPKIKDLRTIAIR